MQYSNYHSTQGIVARKVNKARRSKDFDYDNFQEATFNMVFKSTKTKIVDGVEVVFAYNSSATHQTLKEVVKLIQELFSSFDVSDLRVSELGGDNLRYYKAKDQDFGKWIGNAKLQKCLGLVD